jgi:nicotinate-nucleotide adenylyltransferase
LNWNSVTAVFGGTFDPPHLGHREAVRGLLKNPGVKRVLVVPSGSHPFKQDATSNEHRLAMTQLGFKGLQDIEIDSCEISRVQANASAPTYTIDTILELKRNHPELAFVIGADQLAQLHSWHRFRELLSACHWIVLARRPDGEELAGQVLRQWEASGLIREGRIRNASGSETTLIKLFPTDAPALASADIRKEIARQADPQELLQRLESWLLPEVLGYLMEHRIYGMTAHPIHKGPQV